MNEEEQTTAKPQPPDWQALREQLTTAFAEVGKQWQEAVVPVWQAIALDFVTVFKPVIEQVGEAIPKIVEAIHTAYIEDGAIYGDTQEGLLRWMRERGKIARLRAQADYLEQRHEGLRHFKRAIAEKAAEANDE